MPSISSVFCIADPDLLNKIRLSLAAVCPSAWSLKEYSLSPAGRNIFSLIWKDPMTPCETDKQYYYSTEVSFSSGKAKIRENTKIPKTS